MLDWFTRQSILVQFAIVMPLALFAGLAIWGLAAPRNRLLRRAEGAVRRALEASRADGPPIRGHTVTGAVDVTPSALAVMFAYDTDATLAAAEASGATERLRERVLAALRAARYPAEPASVSFYTDEAVARAGGPLNYFR